MKQYTAENKINGSKTVKEYHPIEKDNVVDSFIDKLLYQVEIMSLNF